MAFCINCGKKLKDGAKFCDECGTKVDVSPKITPNEEEVLNNYQDNKEVDSAIDNNTTIKTKREKVYEGKIHKCPNCGEILNSFVISCPSCGYEIRSTSSSSAIEAFSKKITNCNDEKQIINLIRTFPIPNSKEDLFEFLLIAKSNIKYFDKNNDGKISEEEQELLNAWFTKINQCHNKAVLLFKNPSDVELFENTVKEINSTIKEVENLKNKMGLVDKSEQIKAEFKKSKATKIWTIIGFVFSSFWLLLACVNNKVLCIIISILMLLCFLSVYFIGNQVIKLRIRKIYIIPLIVGHVLFIPYLTCIGIDNNNNITNNNYETINWNEIELKDYVPNIDKKGEVEENTETSLHIEFAGLTEAEHNQVLKDVKAMGYTNVKLSNSVYYNAYNAEEYYLEVWWSDYNGTMDFYLDAPINMSTINWDNIYMKDYIPIISSTKGVVSKNTQKEMEILVDDISYDEYLQFVKATKEMGYTEDIKESEHLREYSYVAFNTDGTKMDINYNECINNFEIILTAPETYSEFVWPSSSIVNTLPKPKSNVGKILYNSDTHFEVIVANTTFSEFQSYVNDCMSKGYNEDYYWWDDDSFSADKGDYDLSVKYIGNNVMKINLYYWG